MNWIVSILVVLLLIFLSIVIGVVVLVECCCKKTKKNKRLDFGTERSYSKAYYKADNHETENLTNLNNKPVPKNTNNTKINEISEYKVPRLNYTNLYFNAINNSASVGESKTKNVFKIDTIYLSNWHDSSNSYYYHYTSLLNARQILKDRKIKANIPKVKYFGKGIFFTVLKPNSPDEHIIKNNYIYYSKAYLSNVQCAFAFLRNDLILKKKYDKFSRDIWRHDGDINLNHIKFKVVIRDKNFSYLINI